MSLAIYISMCFLVPIFTITETYEMNEREYLTQNLFHNLNAVAVDDTPTGPDLEFIDEHIQNYVTLMKEKYGIYDNLLARRSLDYLIKDENGVYILDGFIPMDIITTHNPKYIKFFKQNDTWYAAALEYVNLETTNLVLYKYNDTTFLRIETPFISSTKLFIYSVSSFSFIVVLGQKNQWEHHQCMDIYKFNLDEMLIKIQSLNVAIASSITIWESYGNIYLAVSSSTLSKYSGNSTNGTSCIYKWLGQHFDITVELQTSTYTTITPIVIGSNTFLVVANLQFENENNTYLEILKYDLTDQTFILYQKILANSITDIKYFCFQHKSSKESFLIVANIYVQTSYSPSSVIYKYVNNYFIPFQKIDLVGVTEWLPVVGLNGEFALLTSTKFDGIKTFFYDGWKFVQSNMLYNYEGLNKGIASMHFYNFNEDPILVVANKNDQRNTINVFKLRFSFRNMLKSFQEDYLHWCNKALLENYTSYSSQNAKSVRNIAAPFSDDLSFSQSSSFVNIILKNEHNLKDEHTDESMFENFEEIRYELDNQLNYLTELETFIKTTLQTINVTLFEDSIYVDKVTLYNDIYVVSIIAQLINNMDVTTFLRNVIDVNELFTTNKTFLFSNLRVEESIFPIYINERKSNEILVQQDLQLNHFFIEGNIILDDGIRLYKTINDVKFGETLILLNRGGQILNGDFKFINIDVEKIDTCFLNKLNISEVNVGFEKHTLLIQTQTIIAANIVVGGFTNNLDIPILNKFALHTLGNQNGMINKYEFQKLYVKNIIADFGSIQNIQTIILVNSGNYEIKQDIQFVYDVNIHRLNVFVRLNQITTSENFDALLYNAQSLQHITGIKYFHTVESLKPLNLQGNIKSKDLEGMNPITIIEEVINLSGKYIIDGNATIEKKIQSKDITALVEKRSLNYISHHGLKSSEKEIPLYIHYLQQFKAEQIYLKTINDISSNSWLSATNIKVQYITGCKIISQNIHVTGNIMVAVANNIKMQELDGYLLKKSGDQVIDGKHHIKDIVAMMISSVNPQIGLNFWKNAIVMENIAYIYGITWIDRSVNIQSINTNKFSINGFINNYDFFKLLEDSIHYSNNLIINSHKMLKKLNVPNIYAEIYLGIHNPSDIIKKINAITFLLEESVKLPINIEIENINFFKRINEITINDFKKEIIYGSLDRKIYGKQDFDKVTIYGSTFLNSNYLNRLSIIDLFKNTINLGELPILENVIFTHEIVSTKPAYLRGIMNGLDIENLIKTNEEFFSGKKIFKSNITVNGNIKTIPNISRINFTDLCAYGIDSTYKRRTNLFINGNGYFSKVSKTNFVNNKALENIWTNIWLSNRKTILAHFLQFEYMLFTNTIFIEDQVDEVHLEWLLQNYFSKTNNQTIPAWQQFTKAVDFENGVTAMETYLEEDRLFDIELSEFIKVAILNETNQVFKNIPTLNICNINGIRGDFLVNNLNFQRDVMRYDMENIITGKKMIPNVIVHIIVNNKNIQNVDVQKWIHNSTSNLENAGIKGYITFNNWITFPKEGFGSTGVVNGFKFNEKNIAVLSKQQNILQKKSFLLNVVSPLRFMQIKMIGLLSNANITKLLYKQTFKTKLITISTPTIIDGELFVENLNINQSVKETNFGGLLYKLRNCVQLYNYYKHYLYLQEVTDKLQEIIKDEANFVNYYKEIQEFQNVLSVHEIKLHDGHSWLGVVLFQNSTTILFYTWDQTNKLFKIESGRKIILEVEFLHIHMLSFVNSPYLFVERKNEKNIDVIFMGNNFQVENNITTQQLPTNGTLFIKEFILPDKNQKCVIVTQKYDGLSNIFCQREEGFIIHQQLQMTSISKVNIVTINRITFLIFTITEKNYEKNHINILRFDENTRLFNIHQVLQIAVPNSISTISYKGLTFLAIASKQLIGGIYPGTIEIRRFDSTTEKFIQWQVIKLNVPINVKYAISPTEELLLYVSSDNPAEPLIVYIYQGISGFIQSFAATTRTITDIDYVNTFSNDHLIITKHNKNIKVIHAIFKGYKHR